MSRTDKPRADPRVVTGYLATLVAVTAISWLSSRIAQRKPDPWMGERDAPG